MSSVVQTSANGKVGPPHLAVVLLHLLGQLAVPINIFILVKWGLLGQEGRLIIIQRQEGIAKLGVLECVVSTLVEDVHEALHFLVGHLHAKDVVEPLDNLLLGDEALALGVKHSESVD